MRTTPNSNATRQIRGTGREAESTLENLRRSLTPNGWMWAENLGRWDRGQREHLTHLIQWELSTFKKTPRTSAKHVRLEQALLALEYVERTDRSVDRGIYRHGGVRRVVSGGLPSLGKSA